MELNVFNSPVLKTINTQASSQKKNVFSPPIGCPEMIITNLVAVLVREAVECMDLRLLGPGPALLRDLH